MNKNKVDNLTTFRRHGDTSDAKTLYNNEDEFSVRKGAAHNVSNIDYEERAKEYAEHESILLYEITANTMRYKEKTEDKSNSELVSSVLHPFNKEINLDTGVIREIAEKSSQTESNKSKKHGK